MQEAIHEEGFFKPLPKMGGPDIPIVSKTLLPTTTMKIPKKIRVAGPRPTTKRDENVAKEMLKQVIQQEEANASHENAEKNKMIEQIIRNKIQEIPASEMEMKSLEKLRQEIEDEISALDTKTGSHVLDHLGQFVEEPFVLLESYFDSHYLERLVRHQVESYNHFINYQIQRTIQMFNNVVIRSENDYIAEEDMYSLEIQVSFDNFKMHPPQIYENNGATKTMLPQEAKIRNFTYASGMTVDVNVKYLVRENGTKRDDAPIIIEKKLPKINIGKMPIMLKSSICVLTQNRHIDPVYTGECPMDCGGYFIIKGNEKTVLGQERAAENRIYCFDGKNTTKWSWFAEIKSVPDNKCISPKQVEMMIASKNNGFGHGIYVNIPRFKQPIELFVLFRALGVVSDRDICSYILLNIEDAKQKELVDCLEASIMDANKYMTQEDAFKHVVSLVSFVPINMDKETGARKKREFAMEVLNGDLFPHCKTGVRKLYLLGTMAKKLLQASLGWVAPDDRDSYLNKRIELTGTLLNNLFRNYFNKLVKEMQKQVVREINTGSWRSTENYTDIINMTNIYKIMKPNTIENGITRALSTGDFSIKQSANSREKSGVAQVLSRMTYISSISHLRRINTPLEKSGELIDPRKLHNTTWGFLCPAETPEGQSIGVVKNISYMGHLTIPTNSSSIYEYVEPKITLVENVGSPGELYDRVKVFINGAWIGVTDNPVELYNELKEKKCSGVINIYTSIVFDYKNMEIRVCNDGGRLTRPVLRVRNNRALLTLDIVRKVENRELSWNDLLTNCRIPESVIEYIDPEEQNYSMIAMKAKDRYLQDPGLKIQYTHCEIHPSTIFGVLASCIPFPEHNQAPRNTYQCLDPETEICMGDGTYKKIKDVKEGDMVYSFHPETFETTPTPVIGQFIQPTNNRVYSLTTISGKNVIATEDHKFMTNKGWKTVGDCIADNTIKLGNISINNLNVNENRKIILTREMFINKMINMEIEQTKNRKINKIDKYANTLESLGLIPLYSDNNLLIIISRIIGFLLADGSINVYKRIKFQKYISNEFQCSFDFGTYKDAVDFQNDIEMCGFKLNKIMEGTRVFTSYGKTVKHHTYTCIYNGVLPAFIISLGINYGKKTESTRTIIPSWIMENMIYNKEFLRGFQGGDGCKITNTSQNNICMHSTTQQTNEKYSNELYAYMNQCIEILNMHNIDAYMVQPSYDKDSGKLIVGYQIRQHNDNLIRYFDNIGYAYSHTKYIKSLKSIEYLKCKLYNKKYSNKYLTYENFWETEAELINDTIFEKIEKIEEVKLDYVSCIETLSENHSFILRNGLMSSNCAMGKQAIGVYCTNYNQRMDKSSYVLCNPSRPLVDTRLMNFIHLNKVPSGCQITVAIMTHTGYNQEDSVLINRGAIDRGLFMATIYHTEKDEDKNIIRDEIIRCKPNKDKTKKIKFGNYDKLNSHGFIPENTLVENRDVIIAKIVPIKENRNDPTKTIKYEDQSKTVITTEETYIDKNYTGRNGDGYNFAKVRMRILRKPVLGDKFSSRHGQKGTAGNIIAECDMPYTRNGVRPDIIINPHAIPSRMTIAQLKETLLGKVLVELGMFGDGTSFGNLDIKTIAGELQKLGYESYGNEIMYNGMTGEQMETSVFIGPVFYQRLKHMVNDKQHSRAKGPMVNLTRQPAEGRAKQGGFRIGEMERDVMIAHGMSWFTKDRLLDVSDKYSVWVCKKCGMMCSYNDGETRATQTAIDFTIHKCNTCDNMTDFARVCIPYSYKLLSQELQTINVVPRLIVE